MEQVCNICGLDEEDIERDTEITVSLICDNCLKSELLPNLLDKIFMK